MELEEEKAFLVIVHNKMKLLQPWIGDTINSNQNIYKAVERMH